MSIRLGGVSAFAVLFAPQLAHAAKHQVCLYLDIGGEFYDASPYSGNEYREEFGRNESNTSYPAQRWLAQVVDNNGIVLYGWEPLDGDGCASIDVTDPTKPHVLQWIRWAHWEDTGNHVVAYDCDSAMEECQLVDLPELQSFTPGGASVSEVIVDYGANPTNDARLPRDMVMWATSFAEERMNSLGETPLANVRSYVTYDEGGVMTGSGVVPGEDNASQYVVGNQPGFSIQEDGYHRKFTIAHEYGHVNSIVGLSYQVEADINYCYDESSYPVVMTCPSTHSSESAEWSAVAAMEGVAHWYSVSVWHDIDLDPPNLGSPNWPTSDVNASEDGVHRHFRVPRAFDTPLCNDSNIIPTLNCPSGVSNEWDWLSLFQVLRRDSGISLKKTFQLLGVVHGSGNWVPDGPNTDFFDAVDLAAQQTFSASEYQVWQAEAAQWQVDQ